MTGLVIAAAALCGLVLLAKGYFAFLSMRYPEPVQANEMHTIATKDGWQILLYRRLPREGRGEPVLLCHSLSSNHLNFEIPAGESLVDVLSEAGYDCWGIDTRACRSAVPPRGARKGSATLDGVLLHDLPAAVAFILERTGYSQVHWVGHSLGGMLLYAYALRFGPAQLAGGVTLGSPPGFKGSRLAVRPWISAIAPLFHGVMEYFMRALVPFATRRHPRTELLPINWKNVHPKLSDAELFHAVEMPAPRIAAQMELWASRGIWTMCDGTLDVQARLPELTVPLLAVFGGVDPLVPLREARDFVESIAAASKQMLVLSRANGQEMDYSHIELVFARNGRLDLYEPIVAWLRAHPTAGLAPAIEATKKEQEGTVQTDRAQQ